MNLLLPRMPVLVGALAATLVAVAGALATDLGSWYARLVLPSWKPPDWAFGPVWTVIFVLCAVVGVRAWDAALSRAEQRRVLLRFTLNGALNFLWSVLFFTLHRPDWALWEVGPLWLSILWLIAGLRPLYPPALPLLLPYALWVAVAAAMNGQIVLQNPPFGVVPR